MTLAGWGIALRAQRIGRLAISCGLSLALTFVAATVIHTRVYDQLTSAAPLLFVLAFASSVSAGMATQSRLESLEVISGRTQVPLRLVTTAAPTLVLVAAAWPLAAAAGGEVWLVIALIRTVLLSAGVTMGLATMFAPGYAVALCCGYLSVCYFLGGGNAWNLLLAPASEGSLEFSLIIFFCGWLAYSWRGGKSTTGIDVYQQ